MGNTGRPSTGCARCRKRRIKCDERKPGCFRCEKLGEECPGYPHGFWVFRDENEIARKKALKQSRSKEAADTPKSDGSGLDRGSTVPKNDQQNPSSNPWKTVDINTNANANTNMPSWESPDQALTVIQPALLSDIEFRSVCLFMENFTLDPPSNVPEPAYLDFLPELYLSSSTNPSLRHALSAVALTNFANRYGAKNVASNAISVYGKALSATNKALRDPSTADCDSTLAAVHLLSLYELICHPDMPTVSGVGWANHVFGSFQLLRLRWAKRLISTTTQRQLFQVVHTSILIKAVMTYEAPPSDSIGFILGQDYPEGLGAKIASIFFCKAAELRARVHNAITRSASNTEDAANDLSNVLEEAEALLRSQSFENWCANKPRWRVQQAERAYPSATNRYAFTSNAIMMHWVHHWAVIMCLQKSMIDGLTTMLTMKGLIPTEHSELERHGSKQLNCLRRDIQDTADKILGSIEYALTGESKDSGIPQHWSVSTSSVGALQVFWPVGSVKHTPFTNAAQKSVATEALKRIGNEMSIAQALLHAYV